MKKGSSIVGSGHDATGITLNYCSQVGNTVTLMFPNHDTVFLYSLNYKTDTNKPNATEYYLVFLSSFFPDHAAEVYCERMTVLYLS